MENLKKATTNSSYRDIVTRTNILVAVPAGKFVRHVAAHMLNGREVPAHYENAIPIQGTNVFIKRNFYVSEKFLGCEIRVRVFVQERTNDDGRKIMILNYYPADGEPLWEIKFPQDGRGDIEVPGTKAKIWFKQIGQRK